MVLAIGCGAALGAFAKSPPAIPQARAWDLSSHEKKYSQYNEELIVRHFFEDQREGVFVDVGCFHWRDYSTTLLLEEELGWTGVGVDALPGFRAGYERNRPGTRFYNYAVAKESGGSLTLHVYGALTSTDRSRIDAWNPDAPKQMIEVPAITLSDLLDEAKVSKIDFLSIDIEGAEADALEGFDIERFAPALVAVEVSPANRDPVEAWFERHGYERLQQYAPYDIVNTWYAPVKQSPAEKE